MLDSKLQKFLIKEERINTNNAWGFGGKSGTMYTLSKNVQVFKGKFYYRHAPPSDANSYYINGLSKTKEEVYKHLNIKQ